MNGDFAQGTITFTADLPQEVIDKVLANTKEDMDKWLEAGNTFDLSDGADRTVAYISFPKGTKLEDVTRVVRCRECDYKRKQKNGQKYCGLHGTHYAITVTDDWFCADGRRNP